MLPRLNSLNLTLLTAIAIAVAVLVVQRPPSRGVEIVRGTPPPGVDQLLVNVTGAVTSPGLIEAQRGDRIADVLDRAGGLTEDADPAAVNLARRVRDEDHIHVPRLGEATALLDLNTATAEQLEALPGIGPVYASRIIEARTQLPFDSSDDLLERDVIPAHTYEQIRDLVAVAAP